MNKSSEKIFVDNFCSKYSTNVTINAFTALFLLWSTICLYFFCSFLFKYQPPVHSFKNNYYMADIWCEILIKPSVIPIKSEEVLSKCHHGSRDTSYSQSLQLWIFLIFWAEQGGMCIRWIFFFFSLQLMLSRNQRALCLPAPREAQYRWISSVLCSLRWGLVCLLRDWPLLSGWVERSLLRKPWTKGSPSSTNSKVQSRSVSQVHSADVKRSQVLFAGRVTNSWETEGISINQEWPKWMHPSHSDGLSWGRTEP